MLVFRVEDKNGSGPYRNSKCPESLSNHNGCPKHPNGWRDNIETLAFKHIRYGFSSYDKLSSWFFGHIKFLKENFYIAVYEVDEEFVRHGQSGKQLIFSFPDAVLLEKKKFGSKLKVLKKEKV